VLALGAATPACRSSQPAGSAAATDGQAITAHVVPSVGDAHLALLPPPVQLLVQARPQVLFADPTLSLAVGAFLAAMAGDAPSAVTCMERLSRDADVVTYAWIGGIADGWVALVDSPLDAEGLTACVRAFGIAVPPEGVVDPPVGSTLRLGEVMLARLGPKRRALGLLPTVEAVRAAALARHGAPVLVGAPEDILSRLRQGDVKLFVDLDQLAGLGALDLPLGEDADRLGLLLRLEAMRAVTVALIHARSAPAITRVEATLDALLSGVRRAVLDEPGVSTASVYRIFDEAQVERLGDTVRLEVDMDPPTLQALITLLAHRALPRLRGGGAPAAPSPPPGGTPGADGGTAETTEPDAGPGVDSATEPAESAGASPAEAGSR
jgi:hypothetical protein